MVLRPAGDLRYAALAVLAAERRRLRRLGVPGELVLVGGSSVPGALTHGDVDLHLRVPPGDFADAVARLRLTYRVAHPQIWTSTLATFELLRTGPPPVGLAATPLGSEHDVRFTCSWALLAGDPALVAEYNSMKLAGDGPDGAGYEERKSAFFDRLVASWPPGKPLP
ncbi:MAG TPA: hypothetical protein VKB14_14420 [Actinomycetales bacterium]|nr:hypothetical protein [Actinomycetales bacterium]